MGSCREVSLWPMHALHEALLDTDNMKERSKSRYRLRETRKDAEIQTGVHHELHVRLGRRSALRKLRPPQSRLEASKMRTKTCSRSAHPAPNFKSIQIQSMYEGIVRWQGDVKRARNHQGFCLSAKGSIYQYQYVCHTRTHERLRYGRSLVGRNDGLMTAAAREVMRHPGVCVCV